MMANSIYELRILSVKLADALARSEVEEIANILELSEDEPAECQMIVSMMVTRLRAFLDFESEKEAAGPATEGVNPS